METLNIGGLLLVGVVGAALGMGLSRLLRYWLQRSSERRS